MMKIYLSDLMTVLMSSSDASQFRLVRGLLPVRGWKAFYEEHKSDVVGVVFEHPVALLENDEYECECTVRFVVKNKEFEFQLKTEPYYVIEELKPFAIND